MMEKKVAIIMINYKHYAKRFLHDSFASLEKLNYPKDKYRVYVVDNVTSPETIEICQQLAPGASIVPSSGNGWGLANNLGVKQAIKDGFDDYFFFVNMDTEFDAEFVTEAVRAYESDNRIGIVQSKLLLHTPVDGKYMLNSKGNNLTFLGFGYCAGDGKTDDVKAEISDITYASGAALLVSKKVWQETGEFDESYFMYHDDVEINFKVKLAGYRTVLAPRSVVYHKHEFGRSIVQINFMERNRLRFLLEFYKWQTLLLIMPAWIIMEIGMFPYAIINKWVLIKLKVYGWFLNPKNIWLLARKRKAVQSLRKVSDKELLKGVVAVVDFQQINNPVLKYIANPIFDFYWSVCKSLINW
ncbi:MAG: glycosyltransferase family 2 protein [Candidatus Gastranaerophilaceae bacterium]